MKSMLSQLEGDLMQSLPIALECVARYKNIDKYTKVYVWHFMSFKCITIYIDLI